MIKLNKMTLIAVNFCCRELDLRQTLACNLGPRSSGKVRLYFKDPFSLLFKTQNVITIPMKLF